MSDSAYSGKWMNEHGLGVCRTWNTFVTLMGSRRGTMVAVRSISNSSEWNQLAPVKIWNWSKDSYWMGAHTKRRNCENKSIINIYDHCSYWWDPISLNRWGLFSRPYTQSDTPIPAWWSFQRHWWCRHWWPDSRRSYSPLAMAIRTVSTA